MIVGFDELYLPTLCLHEGFDGSHCLVVHDQKCRGVSKGVKMGVDMLKSHDNVMVGGGFDWHSKDVVGMIGIGDKEKLLAIKGLGRECTSAVCVEGAHLFVGKGGIAEYIGCCMGCLLWWCKLLCAEVERLAKF